MRKYETPTVPKSVVASSATKLLRGQVLMELLRDKAIPEALSQSAPSIEYRPDGDETVASLVNPPVPAAIPLILGETIHNLRGALDHITTAIHNFHKGIRDTRIKFPVSSTKENLLKSRRGDQLYKDIPELWDFIFEIVKPYSDEDGNKWLYRMCSLSNTDKHRMLMTTFLHSTASDDVIHDGGVFMKNAVVNNGPGRFEFARFKGNVTISPRPIASSILLCEPEVGSAPLDQALACMFQATYEAGLAIQDQTCV